jgi:hypothetical protein
MLMHRDIAALQASDEPVNVDGLEPTPSHSEVTEEQADADRLKTVAECDARGEDIRETTSSTNIPSGRDSSNRPGPSSRIATFAGSADVVLANSRYSFGFACGRWRREVGHTTNRRTGSTKHKVARVTARYLQKVVIRSWSSLVLEKSDVVLFWFSVKMRGSVSPKGRKMPPFGGDFQGMRIYRSDVFLVDFWAALTSHRP